MGQSAPTAEKSEGRQIVMGIGTNLGKGEVECSIHSGGTTLFPRFLPFMARALFHRMCLDACHCTRNALRCGAKSGQFVHAVFAMKNFNEYGYMTLIGFAFIAGYVFGQFMGWW